MPSRENVSLYLGGAYAYEFVGKAKATSRCHDIDAPSLKGSTGIGEFGVTFKPSKSRPISLDLGIQGDFGKREGVTGSLWARYAF